MAQKFSKGDGERLEMEVDYNFSESRLEEKWNWNAINFKIYLSGSGWIYFVI